MAPMNKRVTRVIRKKVTKVDVQKWASVQRGEYTRLKKGLRSKINPGQIAKLDGIGFEWASPKRKKSTAKDEGGENLMNLNQSCFENEEPDESWEFMFEQYKKCNPNPTEVKAAQNIARREARMSLSPEVKAAQNQKKREAHTSLSPQVKAAQNQKKNEAWREVRKSLSPEVKSAQQLKRNFAQNKARWSYADKKSAEDAYMENLASRILDMVCLLYTSPSPRDGLLSRMPSSA